MLAAQDSGGQVAQIARTSALMEGGVPNYQLQRRVRRTLQVCLWAHPRCGRRGGGDPQASRTPRIKAERTHWTQRQEVMTQAYAHAAGSIEERTRGRPRAGEEVKRYHLTAEQIVLRHEATDQNTTHADRT
jgi:hypothetical protein